MAEITEDIDEEAAKNMEKKSSTSEKSSKKTASKKSLEVVAEKESTTGEKSIEEKKNEVLASSAKDIERKKKALLEKVKKLKEKVSAGEVTSEELKEKVRAKKKSDMLVPLDEYVKAGIYLGTRVVTPNMKPFVYRRRADGLAIFNTDLIDEKLKVGIEFFSKFAPEDVILVCKRPAGWKVAEKFSEVTGIRVFTKKYPAGILTNKILPDFFENELTIITDQWVDKNALNDTLKAGKKVLMICDTNNFSKGADVVIIGNNKHDRSLGLIFYLLAREYCKARGINANIPDLEWWVGEDTGRDERKKPMQVLAEPGAQFGV